MDRYITTRELSEITGIPRNSIYRLVREGEIKYYKIGKHYRFKMSDFEKGETNEEEMVSRHDWRGYPNHNSDADPTSNRNGGNLYGDSLGIWLGGNDGDANTDDSSVSENA